MQITWDVVILLFQINSQVRYLESSKIETIFVVCQFLL